MRLLTVLLTALLCASSAQAHDTWFERRATSTPTRPELILGTGNQFPVIEFPNGIEHVVSSGCRAAGSQRAPLKDVDASSPHLVLGPSVPLNEPGAQGVRISCWAQLQPFEVSFDDELVERYFKEVQPAEAVRQAWAAQNARGVRWRERYVKHARMEWFARADQSDPSAALPTPMDMDALLLQPLSAPRVGDELSFQVLRLGQPLAHFSVEFRHASSRFGVWRRTDEQGRVSLRAPLAGRWLLRGIELTPPASDEQPWEGQFLTLAFDVMAPLK